MGEERDRTSRTFYSENPDRHKYIEAMHEEGFVNKTVSYLRYALGYTNNACRMRFQRLRTSGNVFFHTRR